LGRHDPDRAIAIVRRFQRIVLGLALAAAGDRAAADGARQALWAACPHASLPDSGRGTFRARLSAMSDYGAMTCAQVHDVVAELALGALTGRERAAAPAPLEPFRACREGMRRLMVVAGLLLELLPPARPSAGFATRVLQRLTETLAADNPFRPKPRRAERRKPPALR
jgi:hypothetical protein